MGVNSPGPKLETLAGPVSTEIIRSDELEAAAADWLSDHEGLKAVEINRYGSAKELFDDLRPGFESGAPTVGTLNFVAGLAAGPGNLLGNAFRERPVYRRAQKAGIDLAGIDIDDIAAELNGYKPWDVPGDLQEKVYRVYELMALLVVERDPGVIRASGSEVDKDYLKR